MALFLLAYEKDDETQDELSFQKCLPQLKATFANGTILMEI